MRASRGPRVIRGLLASSIATFVALLSHVSAGADMPGPLGIAVPWLLSFFVCVILAGKTLSLLRLSIAVAMSQTLFHVLFVLGTVPLDGISMPMHDHSQMGMMMASAPEAASSSTVAAVSGDAVMWIAHGVAAAITVAALYHGERVVRAMTAFLAQVRSWARRAIVRVLVPLGTPARISLVSVFTAPSLRASVVHLASVSRRGPPVSFAR